MNSNSIIATTILAFGLAGGAAVFAKTGSASENDALANLASAKVSLVQAIGAAEAQVGGKATQAELDGEHGATVYKVEVVSADSQVHDVVVDVTNGHVLSSKLDQADRGGKEGSGENEDD